MFKALLIETVSQFDVDLDKLSASSRIGKQAIIDYLDPNSNYEPTRDDYSAIVRSIPVSMAQVLSETLKDEIGYIDAQLELMESNCDDRQLPMFTGMRRILQRIVS